MRVILFKRKLHYLDKIYVILILFFFLLFPLRFLVLLILLPTLPSPPPSLSSAPRAATPLLRRRPRATRSRTRSTSSPPSRAPASSTSSAFAASPARRHCAAGFASMSALASAVPVVFFGRNLMGWVEKVISCHINGFLVPFLKQAGACAQASVKKKDGGVTGA